MVSSRKIYLYYHHNIDIYLAICNFSMRVAKLIKNYNKCNGYLNGKNNIIHK